MEKRVDESWKDSVHKERQAPPAASAPPAPSEFLSFVSTLAMQSLIAMGEIPHPATGQAEIELTQAQYMIDAIQMLSEKTQGNLSEHESAELKKLLYEIRLKFVQKKQGSPE